MSRRVLNIAHRGFAADAPENTMCAFRAALDTGAEMIETDLRLCASGDIVLSHDAVVTATDGSRHPVAERAAAELAALDLGAGEGVPSLRELVGLARGRVRVMADLKEEGFEERVVEGLRPLGWENCLVAGASPASRERLRAAAPSLPLSLTLSDPPPEPLTPGFPHAIDTPVVTWEHALLTETLVQDLHARGLVVYPWTVNGVERMRELIAMGVDGIITDRADRLTALLREPR